MSFVLSLYDIYKDYYGNSPYVIDQSPQSRNQSVLGSDLSYVNSAGVEIFLPVTLRTSTQQITFDCCTMRVTPQKTIVRTALTERIGSVKEEVSIDDYIIDVKGMLIGKNRNFPDEEILIMKDIWEGTEAVYLDCALSDLFLEKSNKVVLTSMDFPDQEGKHIRFRPFSFSAESDFIDTLSV